MELIDRESVAAVFASVVDGAVAVVDDLLTADGADSAAVVGAVALEVALCVVLSVVEVVDFSAVAAVAEDVVAEADPVVDVVPDVVEAAVFSVGAAVAPDAPGGVDSVEGAAAAFVVVRGFCVREVEVDSAGAVDVPAVVAPEVLEAVDFSVGFSVGVDVFGAVRGAFGVDDGLCGPVADADFSDEESADEVEVPVSASAAAAGAMAAPMPRARANAPTRPTNFALWAGSCGWTGEVTPAR